jgi:hypothetical protein
MLLVNLGLGWQFGLENSVFKKVVVRCQEPIGDTFLVMCGTSFPMSDSTKKAYFKRIKNE